MCLNFDEEKMSRAAAFITDCSHDKRCDGTPASVAWMRDDTSELAATGEQISKLTDG